MQQATRLVTLCCSTKTLRYQPFFNVMIASEWGAPKLFRRGFQPDDVDLEDDYGRRLNVYDWAARKLVDTIHLGNDGK